MARILSQAGGSSGTPTEGTLNLYASTSHATIAAFVADTAGELLEFQTDYSIGDYVKLTGGEFYLWKANDGSDVAHYEDIADDVEIAAALAAAQTADGKAVAAQSTADSALTAATELTLVQLDLTENKTLDYATYKGALIELTISGDYTIDFDANWTGADAFCVVKVVANATPNVAQYVGTGGTLINHVEGKYYHRYGSVTAFLGSSGKMELDGRLQLA